MVTVKIVSFHRDQEDHWYALLSCGHTRHFRHLPPWQNRPWVEQENTRNNKVGTELFCQQCQKTVEPVNKS